MIRCASSTSALGMSNNITFDCDGWKFLKAKGLNNFLFKKGETCKFQGLYMMFSNISCKRDYLEIT